jgi:hypothetical protein
MNPRVGGAAVVVLALHFRSSPCGPAITHRKPPRTFVQGTCRRAFSTISIIPIISGTSIGAIAAAAIDRDPRAPGGAASPTPCRHLLVAWCRSARSRRQATASRARLAPAPPARRRTWSRHARHLHWRPTRRDRRPRRWCSLARRLRPRPTHRDRRPRPWCSLGNPGARRPHRSCRRHGPSRPPRNPPRQRQRESPRPCPAWGRSIRC